MTTNENIVIGVILFLLRSKGLHPPALGPETVLDGSLGLESLDFAEIVVRLEEITGKDPFASATTQQIRTISDLAAQYE